MGWKSKFGNWRLAQGEGSAAERREEIKILREIGPAFSLFACSEVPTPQECVVLRSIHATRCSCFRCQARAVRAIREFRTGVSL